MSTFCFGLSVVKPSRKVARVMGRIAKAHDCHFIEATIPGTGYQRWFSGPNLGSPFDRSMAESVYAGLRNAGIDTEGHL